MRLVFFGAGNFAIPALQALVAEHDICLVVCPSPQPAGRKKQLTSCPLAQAAQASFLPLIEGATKDICERICQMQAEMVIVCDYGDLLSADMLALTPRGALNIHPSLLPRWRGAAPILRALLTGDRETGVTIMQMDSGLDSGDILLQQKMPITPLMTGGALHYALATMGAQLILQALKEPSLPVPQDESQATYAAKISAIDYRLNFNQSADAALRQVCAFAPRPCAYTMIAGERIKVRTAAVSHTQDIAGKILSADKNGIVIACQQNALVLLEVQRSGKRFMTAADFLRGFELPSVMR